MIGVDSHRDLQQIRSEVRMIGSKSNNKGYSEGEERVFDYADWLNKPGS